jgi:hypothetical protein
MADEQICVCGHPRSIHTMMNGLLACTEITCVCGHADCIHDGFVNRNRPPNTDPDDVRCPNCVFKDGDLWEICGRDDCLHARDPNDDDESAN